MVKICQTDYNLEWRDHLDSVWLEKADNLLYVCYYILL
jgi:hypothetical protein